MGLPGYTINELYKEKEGLLYYFLSTGTKQIIKIVDYTLLTDVKHDIIKTDKIFNFGFADLDENDETNDDVISANGDTYKVLYTVLNSIPYFFEKYPNEAIAVTGSDSTKKYVEKCFNDCKRNCKKVDSCKNKDKRINVYLGYLNKNYEELNKDYNFFGDTEESIEIYEKNKKYKKVFLTKKN